MNKLILSSLNHTWLFDLDGTIVKHNGYKIDGCDTLIKGAEEFLKSIPNGDMVVFITSRTDEYRGLTERFLVEHGIRYDHIIYNAPFGERILFNDRKPSGLETALAVNLERDEEIRLNISIDESR
ncbi:MAG: hypothetical protein LBB94_05710 [Clostridiales bacterium]|jgi:ribonucleotide monophosphatase NagD (HAD superfamily)|nr:hypothetical protein [Clostridiales bacterium]